MTNFAGFILIGGKSSRMGEDKFSLDLNGKTFLEIATETLQKFGDVSFVVSRDKGQATRDKGQKIVRDIYQNRGALGGIHAALTHSKSDWTIILACDYPFVTVDLIWLFVSSAMLENEFDAFAPIQSDGKIQPLCAVYKTETCRKILSEMLENEAENYSVRDFLNRIKTRYIQFSEIEHLPNSEHFFFNVNTPEDFILAVKLQETLTKNSSVEVLKMTVNDIKKIVNIQQTSNLSYWSYEAYADEVGREDSFSIAAKINNRVVGFLVARLISEDYCAELYNIGVDLNFRRQKIGNKLLESFIKHCLGNNLEKIFLEVRESNQPAIEFYLKNNFTVLSKRKKFYTNPIEDAILMVKEISSTK